MNRYINRAFQTKDRNSNSAELSAQRRKAHDAINKCKDARILRELNEELKKKVKLD